MKDLNRHNIFKTPEEYFQDLPERILSKVEQEKTVRFITYSKVAAALVGILIVGASVLYMSTNTSKISPLQANLHEEIDMYISSGFWQAEDILSLAENPDLILDAIILEEWGEVNQSAVSDEDEWWF
jgi:hypothetical protein